MNSQLWLFLARIGAMNFDLSSNITRIKNFHIETGGWTIVTTHITSLWLISGFRRRTIARQHEEPEQQQT
jgi:hypothetical protein